MADARAWIGINATVDESTRAEDALQRILQKPSEIVLYRSRSKTAQTAQQVRVEYTNSTTGAEVRGEAGKSSKQWVVIFGLKGHALEPDTDIQRDDQFRFDGLLFRVVNVVRTIGEVQAMCEAMG